MEINITDKNVTNFIQELINTCSIVKELRNNYFYNKYNMFDELNLKSECEIILIDDEEKRIKIYA